MDAVPTTERAGTAAGPAAADATIMRPPCDDLQSIRSAAGAADQRGGYGAGSSADCRPSAKNKRKQRDPARPPPATVADEERAKMCAERLFMYCAKPGGRTDARQWTPSRVTSVPARTTSYHRSSASPGRSGCPSGALG